MSTIAYLMKDDRGGLSPVDDWDREKLSQFAVGEYVRVELKKPRNPRHHRLFFAMLNVVHRNLPEELQEQYPTVERLRKAITFEAGWFDETVGLDGQVFLTPRSIAWENMDQIEFSRYFDEAMQVITTRVLPGVDVWTLERWVENSLGGTP